MFFIDRLRTSQNTHTHTHTDQLWICSLHALTSVQSAQPQTTTANKTKNQSATDPHTKHTKHTKYTKHTKHTKLWGEGKSPKETQEKKVKQHRTTTNRTSQPPSSPSLSHTKKKKPTRPQEHMDASKQSEQLHWPRTVSGSSAVQCRNTSCGWGLKRRRS